MIACQPPRTRPFKKLPKFKSRVATMWQFPTFHTLKLKKQASNQRLSKGSLRRLRGYHPPWACCCNDKTFRSIVEAAPSVDLLVERSACHLLLEALGLASTGYGTCWAIKPREHAHRSENSADGMLMSGTVCGVLCSRTSVSSS